MEIKIGADELILWLRKNNKANDVDNFVLGRKIASLMQKWKFNLMQEMNLLFGLLLIMICFQKLLNSIC